jgi:RHS repeat-associated protein
MAYSSLPFGDDLTPSQPAIPAPTADDATPLHFTGKERDTESGNDYFGARYYASSMRRFLSPDPSGLSYADPDNPQNLNLYSYVLNNPLIFLDPTGRALQLNCTSDPDTSTTSTDANGNTTVTVTAGAQHCDIWDDGVGEQRLREFQPRRLLNLPLPGFTPHTCRPSPLERLTKGLEGVANLEDASLRAGGTLATAAGTSEAPPVAAGVLLYGTVSVIGQTVTGVAQIAEGVTGNESGEANRAENAGTALSGPISGMLTLAGGGTLDEAARNATREGYVNLGVGLVDKAVPFGMKAAETMLAITGSSDFPCN